LIRVKSCNPKPGSLTRWTAWSVLIIMCDNHIPISKANISYLFLQFVFPFLKPSACLLYGNEPQQVWLVMKSRNTVIYPGQILWNTHSRNTSDIIENYITNLENLVAVVNKSWKEGELTKTNVCGVFNMHKITWLFFKILI
jgi:hypothetical protein